MRDRSLRCRYPRRWSFAALFLLGPSLPLSAAAPAPKTVSPAGHAAPARVEQRCPTFSWGTVEGAERYELVVYEVSGSNAVDTEATPAVRTEIPGTASSWTPALGRCLARGRLYAWSVRVANAPSWSRPSLFEISAEPQVAEVEAALAALRAYLRDHRQAPTQTAPTQTGDDNHPRRAAFTNSSAEPSAASATSRATFPATTDDPPASAPSPIAGAASFSADGQLHLGAASHVFKENDLLLWEDGVNTSFGRKALESNTSGVSNTAIGAVALRLNSEGAWNTANGRFALEHNTVGHRNTALGAVALWQNIDGAWNTAVGVDALKFNTSGHRNTAVGAVALLSNIDGAWNTAVGVDALQSNTAGNANTAIGFEALKENVEGYSNTAIGFEALEGNIGGWRNVAQGIRALGANQNGFASVGVGAEALTANTDGVRNVAVGELALGSNTTGSTNVAVGSGALQFVVTGSDNTGVGYGALEQTVGSSNIALGHDAGSGITDGSHNISIGHAGLWTDSGTIRIGDSDQTRAFISGIWGVTTGIMNGTSVLVDSNGQLGTVSSSRRYKEEIQDMGRASRDLHRLRPVTFRYRQAAADGSKPLQFGLIAEEVAEVLPELVAYDPQGRPQTVKYHLLSTLLLSELQEERARRESTHRAMSTRLELQRQDLARLERQLAELRRVARPR